MPQAFELIGSQHAFAALLFSDLLEACSGIEFRSVLINSPVHHPVEQSNDTIGLDGAGVLSDIIPDLPNVFPFDIGYELFAKGLPELVVIAPLLIGPCAELFLG